MTKSERDKLEEIEAWHSKFKGCQKLTCHICALISLVKKQDAQIEKAIEALEHYADPTEYEDRGLGVTDERIASEALSELRRED